jgi:hypothetical protein
MIWLVDREHHGPSGPETREDRHGSQGSAQNPAQSPLSESQHDRLHDPHLTPGAAAGVTAGPAFDHLNYGFYETESEARSALKDLARDLEKNAPVKVTNGSRTFLIPASRIHYAVCEEVTRPKDEPKGTQAKARRVRG